MQPEILNQLKNELQSKCVAYDYVDATDNALSEFFINLVLVNKTPEEINEELIQLVGSDYNPNLTTWFFGRKAELENPPQAQQQQQIQEQQHIQQQQQQQHVEELQQQQFQQQSENDSMDVVPKTARADRQNRMFTKAIGSVIGGHEKPVRARTPPPRRSSRSRSRSPVRQSSRYNTNDDRYSSRRDDRNSRRQDDRHGARHEEDRNRSGNIFSRLGGSSARNNRNDDDKPSVFDRLGGSKPVPTPTQTTSQERCKYWPNCKNGEECIYVHPSSVCPDFPNCGKTAMECLYIHPEVAKPVMVQPQIKKLPVPCKFFPYCTNPMCPFIHPVSAQQPFFMQAKPNFATSGQRVQIPCKNGDACTRPDCHFLHPKDPNPQAEIVCRFDGACTRPNCFYKHTKENKLINGKPESTNSRQFSVAEDDVVERIHVGESADIIQNQQQNTTEQPATMDMDSDVVMDVN